MEITTLITYALFFVSLYFEVFLLITFFEHRESLHEPVDKALHAHARKQFTPSVTVIVPCHNEESTAAPTIESLLSLSYKGGVSVIAVDDGSTDGTYKELQKFARRENVDILKKPQGGKASAVNYALPLVQTDLVACLDADSFVEPHTLSDMVPYFQDAAVAAVTPALKVYRPHTVLERVQSAEYHLSIFLRKIFSFLGAQFVTPGPFSLYRTSLFEKVGGFRQAHNTEDLEMALRIQSRHYKIENAHTAYVHTVAPCRFKALYKQRLRWTYGFLKNAWDYRSIFLSPQYGNLGLAVLPFALFSIVAALYFALFSITNGVHFAVDTITKMSIVGFSAPNAPELFFINTEALVIIGYTVVAAAILLLAVARKVSHGVYTLRAREIWYYLVLYGIIAPIWLARAVVDVAINRQTKWK